MSNCTSCDQHGNTEEDLNIVQTSWTLPIVIALALSTFNVYFNLVTSDDSVYFILHTATAFPLLHNWVVFLSLVITATQIVT